MLLYLECCDSRMHHFFSVCPSCCVWYCTHSWRSEWCTIANYIILCFRHDVSFHAQVARILPFEEFIHGLWVEPLACNGEFSSCLQENSARPCDSQTLRGMSSFRDMNYVCICNTQLPSYTFMYVWIQKKAWAWGTSCTPTCNVSVNLCETQYFHIKYQ